METTPITKPTPYKFMSVNERGHADEYSGMFETEAEAKQWYQRHGTWLKERFNRRLVLYFKANPLKVRWL